jgi:hypothetical protein
VNFRARRGKLSAFFVPKGVIGQLLPIFGQLEYRWNGEKKVRWNGEKNEGLNFKRNRRSKSLLRRLWQRLRAELSAGGMVRKIESALYSLVGRFVLER